MGIERIGALFDDYRLKMGVDPMRNHVLVYGVAAANSLLREIFFMPNNPNVAMTNEHDEVFTYNGVPVRLRYQCHAQMVYVLPVSECPPRRCCDEAAMQTMLVCLNRGSC